MKLGGAALSYWLLLLTTSCTGPGPLGVTSFAPSTNLNKIGHRRGLDYRTTDHYYHGNSHGGGHGHHQHHGQPKWNNGGGVGSTGPGSSGSTPSDWNARPSTGPGNAGGGPAGQSSGSRHGEAGEGGGGFKVDMRVDGLVIDVQAVVDDNDTEDQDYFQRKYQQQHNSNNNEPRVVEAECIDFIHTKSGPNKLREIAEKEGYDTTDMGQEELEKIARWVQSQRFQREKEQANRNRGGAGGPRTKYSSVPLEELQAVALHEGYDPTGMDRGDLEQIMDWVQSQQYHEQKQQSEQQHHRNHNHHNSKSGVAGGSKNSLYSNVPTVELQEIALAEGYDVEGLDRTGLESIAEWVHSLEYKRQKERSQSHAHSTHQSNGGPHHGHGSASSQSSTSSRYASTSIEDLRHIASEEGYDINGLERKDLEKIAEWVGSQEYKQKRQQSQQDEVKTKHSSTSIQDLQEIACKEGYDIKGLERKDLEKIADWVNSQEYKQQKQRSHQQNQTSSRYASTSMQDLQGIACAEGYDINGLERKDLEKIAEWVNSQEYKQQKEQSLQDQISTKYASTSLEDLQAIAQGEGYDINGLDRRDLEKIADWVNSQEYKQQKRKNTIHSAVGTIYARMSIQDLTKIAQDEGYDTTSLERKDLEKIAEWVHSQQNKQQKAHSEVKASTASRFSSTSLEDLRTIACIEGYDINGLERKDLEQIAEWVHTQQYKHHKAQSDSASHTNSSYASLSIENLEAIAQEEGYDTAGLDRKDLEKIANWVHTQKQKERLEEPVAYGARKVQMGNEFASRSIEELRALAEDKGYDTTGLERKDLEKIAEWVKTMPHQPVHRGNAHSAAQWGEPFKSDADKLHPGQSPQWNDTDNTRNPNQQESHHQQQVDQQHQQNPHNHQQQDGPFFAEAIKEKIYTNQQRINAHKRNQQERQTFDQRPHYANVVNAVEDEIYQNQKQFHTHTQHFNNPYQNQSPPNHHHGPQPVQPQIVQPQNIASPNQQQQEEQTKQPFGGNGFHNVKGTRSAAGRAQFVDGARPTHSRPTTQNFVGDGFENVKGARVGNSYFDRRSGNTFQNDAEIVTEELNNVRGVYNVGQDIQYDIPNASSEIENMETSTVSSTTTNRGFNVRRKINKYRYDHEQSMVNGSNGARDPSIFASHFKSMQGMWKI